MSVDEDNDLTSPNWNPEAGAGSLVDAIQGEGANGSSRMKSSDATNALDTNTSGDAAGAPSTTTSLTDPLPDNFYKSLTAPMPSVDDLPTREEVDACRATYQFTEGEVRSGIDMLRPLIREIGFNDQETDDYYGIQADHGVGNSQFPPAEKWTGQGADDDIPSFEDYWTSGCWSGAKDWLPHIKSAKDGVQSRLQELGSAVYGAGRDDVPSLKTYLAGGYWSAATTQMPLYERGEIPPDMQLPQDSPILQDMAYQAGQLYGELPLEAVSFLAGGPIGAIAIPAAARRAIADGFQRGTADSPKDALHITMDSAIEGFKQLVGMKILQWTGLPLEKVIGGEFNTGNAVVDKVIQSAQAKAAAALAKLPAQAAAMTAYFAALEPHMPRAKEFWETLLWLIPGGGALAGEERPGAGAMIEAGPEALNRTLTPSADVAGEKTQGAQAWAKDQPGNTGDEAAAAKTDEAVQSGGNDQSAPAQASEKASPDIVLDKLFKIWSQTGKRPASVLRDVQDDPSIQDDLLSSSPDIPKAYLKLAETGGEDTGNGPQESGDAEQAAARLQEFKDFAATHPSDNPHEVARDFVLKKNEETKQKFGTANEHLLAVDGPTGDITHHETSNLPDQVQISPELEKDLEDPTNQIVLHHNHPDGSMLSGPDIQLLGLPGVKAIAAHSAAMFEGHLGEASLASLTSEMQEFMEPMSIEGRLALLERVSTFAPVDAEEYLWSVKKQIGLSYKDMGLLLSELTNRALHANGVIDYFTSYKFDQIPTDVYDEAQALSNLDIANLLKQEGYKYGQVGSYRSSISLRAGEGVGRIFAKDASDGANEPNKGLGEISNESAGGQGTSGKEGEEGGRGNKVLKQASSSDETSNGKPSKFAQDCAEEWAQARIFCRDLFTSGYFPRGKGVGGMTMDQCIRGQVSEACGGNPVEGRRR